jgi:hypothetical protein
MLKQIVISNKKSMVGRKVSNSHLELLTQFGESVKLKLRLIKLNLTKLLNWRNLFLYLFVF